jgi:hypothetical protein
MLKQGTLHSPCTSGKLKNPELWTPIKAAMHLKSSIRSLFKLTAQIWCCEFSSQAGEKQSEGTRPEN